MWNDFTDTKEFDIIYNENNGNGLDVSTRRILGKALLNINFDNKPTKIKKLLTNYIESINVILTSEEKINLENVFPSKVKMTSITSAIKKQIQSEKEELKIYEDILDLKKKEEINTIFNNNNNDDDSDIKLDTIDEEWEELIDTDYEINDSNDEHTAGDSDDGLVNEDMSISESQNIPIEKPLKSNLKSIFPDSESDSESEDHKHKDHESDYVDLSNEFNTSPTMINFNKNKNNNNNKNNNDYVSFMNNITSDSIASTNNNIISIKNNDTVNYNHQFFPDMFNK